MDGRRTPADIDTDRNLLSRRAFLGTSALGTAIVSAGCFGDGSGEDDDPVTTDDGGKDRGPSGDEAFASPGSLEVLDTYHAGGEYDSDRAEVVNTHSDDRLEISHWSFETELASITVPRDSYLEPGQRAFIQFATSDDTGLEPDGGLLTVTNGEDDLVTEYEYAADPSVEPGGDDGDRTDADTDADRDSEVGRAEDEPGNGATDTDPGSDPDGSADTGTDEDDPEGTDSETDVDDEGTDDSDRQNETGAEEGDGPAADDTSEDPPVEDGDAEGSTEDDDEDEEPTEDDDSDEEAAGSADENGTGDEERGTDEDETSGEGDAADGGDTDDDTAVGDGDDGGGGEGNDTGTDDLFGG